jgi:hypothetical protein
MGRLISCADQRSLACHVRETDFGGHPDYGGSCGQICIEASSQILATVL